MTICQQPLLVKYFDNERAITEGPQQGVLTQLLKSTRDIPEEGPLLG